MKLHRFLLDKNIEQPLGEELKITEKDLLHQWNNVLKFKKDEKINLFDGIVEKDFIYNIKNISNKLVILEFDKEIENISQKNEVRDINLCLSLVKKEKISLIIEKCTEIGVSNFISLVSDRTEKKNIESFNLEKVIKIAKEAVEQSGWSTVPMIKEPKRLENLKKLAFKYIFIGPEGGWSDKEVAFFEEKGLNFINFGKNILKAETAAIVSSFLMSL